MMRQQLLNFKRLAEQTEKGRQIQNRER